jgi:hypothetical protein
VRDRGDQGQSANLLRMIESKRERNRAAERMPDDYWTLQSERLTKAADEARLRGERGERLVRPQRIAAAGPVENDDAEIVRESAEQRMREVEDLAGKPVDDHKRRPAAFVDIVQPRAVNIDEFAARRHIRFHLVGGPRGEQNKPEHYQETERDDAHDPDNDPNNHFLPPRPSHFQ